MNTIFMIRGYFDVVSEVSRLYVEISREHIMPGVNLIAKLGLTQASNDSENAETVPRNEMLEKYTAGAVSEIKKLAEDVSTPAGLLNIHARLALITLSPHRDGGYSGKEQPNAFSRSNRKLPNFLRSLRKNQSRIVSRVKPQLPSRTNHHISTKRKRFL